MLTGKLTYGPYSMNTRFAVATHILIFLQTQQGVPASSELIGSSVNTNPSLIRRLLSQLARAGLTTSQMGTGGGALLARQADAITLLDVYQSVDDDNSLFGIHADPNPACPIGRNIPPVFKARMQATEQALLAELARTTIASMAAEVAANENSRVANSFNTA